MEGQKVPCGPDPIYFPVQKLKNRESRKFILHSFPQILSQLVYTGTMMINLRECRFVLELMPMQAVYIEFSASLSSPTKGMYCDTIHCVNH